MANLFSVTAALDALRDADHAALTPKQASMFGQAELALTLLEQALSGDVDDELVAHAEKLGIAV